ncbi:MAG: aminotransferase class I/II-fold pyridoxal phosphate-dependent enzyme [Clostridia bacterium]|nr:aminotransferase class I/II-fold pyridoxal phosphate-dependent enzyme [Clostridia bacterium]
MTIFESLMKNAGQRLPMHMPGHKRKTPAKYLKKLAADIDITEIDGFDDLHCPSGLIAEAEERAAALWGAQKSHILVGGSTVGILAGIYSFLDPSDEVLVARNCHKSVYHAVEICGSTPRYIVPERDEKTGIYLSVDPEKVAAALDYFKKIKLVVITSPTYEGVISDIPAIADICHKRGVAMLVDEAHGAHLDLSDKFAGGAVKAGADVVVQSLHKTLPSLTQTAIAHVGGFCDKDKFARALDVFETSSPSYLLMASADGCVDYIKNNGKMFAKWSAAIDSFRDGAKKLTHLSLFNGGTFASDKSKIVVTTAGTSISGFELMKKLREEYDIELEMASEKYAVAMTGMFDTKSTLGKLIRALTKIDKTLTAAEASDITSVDLPVYAITPKEAVILPCEAVFAGEAEGEISAEYVWAYPPGTPLIVPGEVIDGDAVAYAKRLLSLGANVICADKSLKTLKVIKK